MSKYFDDRADHASYERAKFLCYVCYSEMLEESCKDCKIKERIEKGKKNAGEGTRKDQE